MPAPEVTFALLGADQLSGDQLGADQGGGRADEVAALRAEVYAAPPFRAGEADAELFARRFRVQRRQPGFVLAEARSGEYLVGCAFGMPLRPSTSWWREVTAPLPEEFTAERPGRTFALLDLLVRAPWRRQGIGGTLHGLILAGRAEERATLTVLPAAGPAQEAARQWGWRKVARTRDPDPGAPVLDVLVRELP